MFWPGNRRVCMGFICRALMSSCVVEPCQAFLFLSPGSFIQRPLDPVRWPILLRDCLVGGCPFHVYLERLENQDPRGSRLKPLTLQMPPEAWLPLMDIDFTAPFRCLSVQSVLTVFALMLQVGQCLATREYSRNTVVSVASY